MIKLVVDSSSDYTKDELYGTGITLVPIGISLNDKNYLDGIDLNRDEFYKVMTEDGGFPKTAMPSPAAFAEIFENAKQDRDDVICILLSSALSGTYQSAVTAKEMVGYDRVYVVDSLRASFCIKIMVDYAQELIKAGKEAGDIAAQIENLKQKVKVYAALDTLEYLYRGGRLSRTGAVIGAVTNIKPVVTIDGDGKVSLIKKSLGVSRAKADVLAYIEQHETDPRFPVYSLYTYGTENCKKLEENLEERGIKLDRRVQIGPTIGAHVGPEVFGVFFVER